jgi:hypothetical protein
MGGMDWIYVALDGRQGESSDHGQKRHEARDDYTESSKVAVHVWGVMKNSVYANNPHTIDDLKMVITEYIRNADRAILNTVFEHKVRRVNKCLETGGGHFKQCL